MPDLESARLVPRILTNDPRLEKHHDEIRADFKRDENYQEMPTLTKFEGSATRSELKARYDLIPIESLRALGERLALGAARHGERNWMSGGPEFVTATINHLYKHLADYAINGNMNDDNTAAIICNAAFLCYFESKNPRNHLKRD